MNTFKFALVALVLFAFSNVNAADCINCQTEATVIEKMLGEPEGETANSTMVLTVKNIKGSEKKAAKIKKQLMGVNGVKNVSACTTSGTVKVAYNKTEMGCCSKMHSSLKDKGWKYELVSNKEVPACSKGAKSAPACCDKKKGAAKECDGKKKGA